VRELKPKSAGSRSLNHAIRLVHQGDTKAFEIIYRSYCGLVYRICLRMLRNPVDAEDAAQDVFVRVFCKINTFRGESAFSSWLYRVATNTVLMRFRKNKHSVTLEETREVNGGLPGGHGVTRAAQDGLTGWIDLQAAVKVLPDGYKRAFLLHDVHGYAHREIARIFGCSIGCSKSQLHNARKLLRELLRDMPKKRGQQDTKLTSVCVN
jgi:RNA polymerase sigma-70 factor, ECF subfamily